jgi:hypothetical protein
MSIKTHSRRERDHVPMGHRHHLEYLSGCAENKGFTKTPPVSNPIANKSLVVTTKFTENRNNLRPNQSTPRERKAVYIFSVSFVFFFYSKLIIILIIP